MWQRSKLLIERNQNNQKRTWDNEKRVEDCLLQIMVTEPQKYRTTLYLILGGWNCNSDQK